MNAPLPWLATKATTTLAALAACLTLATNPARAQDLPVADPAGLKPADFRRIRAQLADEGLLAPAATPDRVADADPHQPRHRLRVDLVLAYPGAVAHLREVLAEADFAPDAEQLSGGVTLRGTLPADRLEALAGSALLLDVSPALDDDEPYHLECRIGHNVTPLNSSIAGAPHLLGAGVVVGVGDGGYLGDHPDIGDRVVSSTTYYNANWGSHPDMVAGIIGGAGHVNPRHRGTAPEAELVIEPTSGVVYNAPAHLANFGLTLTNNSYGPRFNCAGAGRYYGTSASVDQQLFDEPQLLHVYAAGNAGRAACDTVAPLYGTLAAGAQTAKNTLTVGNAYFTRVRFSSSSSGPTLDGRLKPEVLGVGVSVSSNNRDADYNSGTGTSYSAPAVAGTLALLTERHHQLHAGANPSGALLKAVTCNTADDLGAAGPDYLHGFGLVNAAAALAALERGDYLETTLAPGATHTRDLTVPAGTEQLRVMLYWPDQAGPTTNDRPTLVNDFDLAVVTPAGDTLRPWVLDPAHPAAPASRGRDTLNNIEQVTLALPAPGTYRVVTAGTHLPYGTTDFVLTWSAVAPAVTLTCPHGGETLEPGQQTYIAWQASPGQTGSWTVQYRPAGATGARGGASAWVNVSGNVASHKRFVYWTPPAGAPAYDVRVLNNASGLGDESDAPAQVFASPRELAGTQLCDGGVRLAWAPSPDAAAYEVYAFDGADMALLATVTDTLAVARNLAVGESTFYSVRAVRADGARSQRAYAVSQASQVDGPDCQQAPLPVEWVAVRTEELGAAVRVHWSVATETDAGGYTLQRGTPLGDSLAWIDVAHVTPTGSGRSGADYSADDAGAAPAGTTYYRVRERSRDGVDDFSPVVAHVRGATSSVREAPLFSLSQNPVGETLRFEATVGEAGAGELYDSAGRLRQRFDVKPGANAIALTPGLEAGLYVVRVRTAARTQGLRVYRR